MANLGPLQQNLTYGNLLQVDGGLTGDLKPVLDGDGNASGLSLSFTAAAISGLVTDIASNLYGGAPGSIPYQSSENDTNFVPAGAAGTVLASTGGGAPAWVNTIQYAVNSNIANKLNGGTVGQIPYQTSASNTGFLPVGTSGQVLVSNGAAAPSWTTSVASALAATAAANVAGGSSGNLLYQSATGLTNYVTNGTTGQILKSQGASAPLWSTLTASDVSAVPIDGSLAMTGNLSMGGNAITNLSNPLASTDAATKAYVDSVATGLNIKAACRVASTTNLVLSGLIAVDGVTVSSGDRVLIKDQTAQDTNGIYVASASSWTRATDADSWSELVGATTFISAGSTQANTTWACNVTAGGTLGVTPVTFVLFGASASYTAGTGLTLVGSQFALVTPVSVANGGSGVTTLTGIVKGNGASAFTAATGADVVSLIGPTAVQNATTSTACSGNAATATKLQTPTSINGVSFDGSAASYTITASSPASLTVTTNGFGDTSPFLFNGSTAKIISWNSIGAVSNNSTGLTNPSAWRTNLGASTIGENLFTLTNPGAVTFPRFNADNTVSVLNAEATINALLPSQTGNSGKVLTTNGTSASWGAASSYNPAAVAITGGTINGVSLGATTPITSLTTSGAVDFSSYITVDPLVAAYFMNPRIWDSSQTHWYRITPSELADNRYITLPILNTNDTFVFNNNTATLTNKTISGANNTFSNIGNAALTNSSITINGTSVSLGGSITVSGVGTVTSVDLTTPTGLTVSGGPITSFGTLAIALQTGYSIPTTTSQANWDTAFAVRYRWDGGSTGVVPATGRTSLQLGTTDTPQFAGLILSNKIRLSSTDYSWSSSTASVDLKNGSLYGFDNGTVTTVGVARNLYLNSSNQWTYKTNGYGSVYFHTNTGDHSFYVTGVSGTAGASASLNPALNVLANRNVECKANLDVTNAISINGNYGATGQVLTSGGGGAMTWTAPAGGIYYNVKSYGAVGDGTTDDTAAFNAAISAAFVDADTGGTVYIPNGTYLITSTLSLLGVSILGQSTSSIIVGGSTAAATTFISDVNAPIIEFGGIVRLSNFAIKYNSTFHNGSAIITGSETKGQRVLIRAANYSAGWQPIYSCAVQDIHFDNCGTAFYNPCRSQGTSTTSNTIGLGSKTFTTSTPNINGSLNPGRYVTVYGNGYTGSGLSMFGTVTSYSGTTLVINVTSVTGSGTNANWLIQGPATSMFSTTLSTLLVWSYSYRGFDIRGPDRTGNVYQNIAVTGGGRAYSGSADVGFALDSDSSVSPVGVRGMETESTLSQINVERATLRTAAFIFSQCSGLCATALHIEDVLPNAAGFNYVYMTSSVCDISAIDIINCYSASYPSNVSLFNLNSSNYYYSNSPLPTANYLSIGTLSVAWLGNTSTGISALSAFYIFERGTDDGTMYVNLNNLQYGNGSGDSATWAAFPTSGNLTIINNGYNVTSPVEKVPGSLIVGAESTYTSGRFLFGTTTAPTYTMMSAANVYSNTYVWGYGPTSYLSNQVFAVQQNSGSYLGVQLTWGSTSWGTMSDERRKDIIEPISNALSKVSSLRSVIGKYKSDDSSVRRSMLIAQDFETVFPEAMEDIIVGEEQYLGLRYTDVIPLLVAAVKELSAKVETLEQANG